MITSIYIKNFKAFKELDLSPANLTLLTGSNGMGKTTVIHALLLLRQSYEKKALPGKGLFLNGDYVDIGKGKDAYSMYGEGDHIYFELEWDETSEAVFDFCYSSDSELQPVKSFAFTGKFDPFGTSLFTGNFQYLNAERLSPRILFPTSAYHVEELHSLGNKGEYTVHFIAVNQREPIPIKQLSHPASNNLSLLSQLDAWMGEVVPGVSLNAVAYRDMNVVKLTYKFETSKGYIEEFNPINSGFGLTYALPVVTAVLAAKPGDLLIIENPESHLHPAGQAVIGKLCALAAENGVQIIIESHSDHILNSIRVAVKKKILSPQHAAIYFFERDINAKEFKVDVIQPFIDENGRLDKKPAGFFDEWGKQLDELIK
jgi:predicted ATPase